MHYADGPFSFHLRAGLFYMGDADVTLTATGTSAGLSAFQSELAREEANIEDELGILGFYPAITIEFSYRF